MGQLHRLANIYSEKQDKDLLMELGRAVQMYSESFALRAGVHDALFRNVINMLGNKEQQQQWSKNIDEYRILGCFAMVRLRRNYLIEKNSIYIVHYH
jgi:acyl-CoA oxidase